MLDIVLFWTFVSVKRISKLVLYIIKFVNKWRAFVGL